jgi:hypothetical protein
MLGFDALGRLALGQLPKFQAASANLQQFDKWPPAPPPPVHALNPLNRVSPTSFQDFVNAPGNPNQFFGNYLHWWPRAPAPINFARDWIAFSGNSNIEFPVYTQPFLPFDLGKHARNSAVDWITQFGNISVDTLPKNPVPFSLFDPAPHPRNFAKDWVAYSGNEFVEAFPQVGIDFSRFDPPAPPRNFSKDWVAYSESGFTIVPVNLIGIEFTPFSLGHAAKLWSGQGPQWWPYYFNAPFKPSGRDTHDGGHLRRYWHHRRPSVYSQEYYDELRRLQKLREHRDDDDEELIEEIKRIVPNLLIPLNRLISPLMLPSLRQLPPFRPMPTLTMNPPRFKMATPEEIAADDEQIIAMILSEE